MGKKIIIAIAIAAVLLLAAGLVLYFHQLPKPARIHRTQGVTEFVGVGIQFRMDPQTHTVVIQQVVANSPAAKANIINGSVITKVDGVSLDGKPLAECASLIRGPVGSTVKLDLVTPDGSQTNTVELTRQKFKL
jgi:carboxyl-terminal processing protease